MSARRRAKAKSEPAAIRSQAEAWTDLVEIWNHIAEDSSDGADQVLARLYDTFTRLAQSPGQLDAFLQNRIVPDDFPEAED